MLKKFRRCLQSVCQGKWLLTSCTVKADHYLLIMFITGKAGIVIFGSWAILVSTTPSVTVTEVGCSYLKSCTAKHWNSALFRPRPLFFKSMPIHHTVLGVQGLVKMLWKRQDCVLTFEPNRKLYICVRKWVLVGLSWKMAFNNTYLNCLLATM